MPLPRPVSARGQALRPQWQKQGISDRLHALLREQGEDLAAPLADVTHPRIQELHARRGYDKAGEQQPFADSPAHAVMVKLLQP